MGQPVVHFEIGCRDSGKTANFFSNLFGWNMQPMGPATMISNGADTGIHGHISTLGHEPHQYTIFYVQVDDVKSYLDKAGTLGGKTLVSSGDSNWHLRVVSRPRWKHDWFVEAEVKPSSGPEA
jgi:predicted enzyme related to lactoylglutathione lyase